MKIKVIDLLVDIANNGVHEVTKYFKYFNRLREEYDIRMVRLEEIYYVLNYGMTDINDEVEIIEDTPKEDKKIEKLDFTDRTLTSSNGFLLQYCIDLADKIDEIIDKVNGDK